MGGGGGLVGSQWTGTQGQVETLEDPPLLTLELGLFVCGMLTSDGETARPWPTSHK